MNDNVLSQLRADVAEALTAAGLPARTAMPERPAPPLAVVLPGSQYLAQPDEANTFCTSFTVTLDVLLVMAKGSNQAALEALDAAIVTTVIALGGFSVAAVEPMRLNLNAGQEHLAAVVTLTREIEIGEE